MAFRQVEDSDPYCGEAAGKLLAHDIIDILNKPENSETIRQVFKSDKSFLTKLPVLMLLPLTKEGDFPGTDMGGRALGGDVDVHNIVHGLLILTNDDKAKKSEHFDNLKRITGEVIDMVNPSDKNKGPKDKKEYEDSELKRKIQGNIKYKQDYGSQGMKL